MTTRLPDAVVRARATRDFTHILKAVPYFRFLGLAVHEQEGQLIVVLPGEEKHIGRPDPPFIHGGVIGALLESTALIQLMATDTVHVAKTVNITTNFLRSAKVVDTYACATIAKQGRRIANVHIQAWQEDRNKPIATGYGHFLLT